MTLIQPFFYDQGLPPQPPAHAAAEVRLPPRCGGRSGTKLCLRSRLLLYTSCSPVAKYRLPQSPLRSIGRLLRMQILQHEKAKFS